MWWWLLASSGNNDGSRLAFTLLIAIIIAQAIGLGLAFKGNADNAEQTQQLESLVAGNQRSIEAGHDAQIRACQLANRTLREKINRNIVRPLNDTLEAASAHSLAPEVYSEIARELATVPYNNCHNIYPDSGDPQRPLTRPAPLPPPLTQNTAPGQIGRPGTGASSVAPAAPIQSAPPATPSPSSDPGDAGSDGSPGAGPQPGPAGPPGQPGPAGPPGGGGEDPPPDQAGVLEPVCDLTLPVDVC